MHRRRAIAFLLFLALTADSRSQSFTTEGTDFWTGFMENRVDIDNGPPGFALFIRSREGTSGEVFIAQTGATIPFQVPAGGVSTVPFPPGAFNATGSETVQSRGIHITSRDPIAVTAMHYRLYFSEASIVLPSTRLGGGYRVLAADNDRHLSSSEFMIVAVEDGTEIAIAPSAATGGGRPAGVPFTVVLNRGETYQVKAGENLSGTLVRSAGGRPFVLIGGAGSANIECIADSHVFEQCPPLADWGTRYLLVPYIDRRTYFRIVASEDGTTLRLGCRPVVRLNGGESFGIILTEPAAVIADHPVGIEQLSLGGDCSGADGGMRRGDPSMMVLPPLGAWKTDAGFFAASYTLAQYPNIPFFVEHYLNLVSRVADASSVMLDGVPIGSSFLPFPGVSGYLYARVPVSPGAHRLIAPGGVQAYAYGFGEYNAYSFSLGTDTITTDSALVLASCAPSAAFTADTAICPGCIGFSALDPDPSTTWHWSFSGGSPVESSLPRPGTVCFLTPGDHLVTLIGTNSFGSDTARRTIHVMEHLVSVDSVLLARGLTFDSTQKGSTRCDSIAITNRGSAPYTLESGFLAGHTAFSVDRSQFPLVIPPGDRRMVRICYTPTDTGDATDYISLGDVCSDYTVAITGHGFAPATSARFAAHADDPCRRECVDFDDQSTSAPTSWRWLFPGGTPDVSTERSPRSICYPGAGSYQVTLIATGAQGSDTITRTITVEATAGARVASALSQGVLLVDAGVSAPCIEVLLENPGSAPYTLASARMLANTAFSIPPGQLPLTIPAGGSRPLILCHTRTGEGEERDTLILPGPCAPLMLPVASPAGAGVFDANICQTTLEFRRFTGNDVSLRVDPPHPNPGGREVTIPIELSGALGHEGEAIGCVVVDLLGTTVAWGAYRRSYDRRWESSFLERGLITLDLSALPRGLYFARIATAGRALAVPVMVDR